MLAPLTNNIQDVIAINQDSLGKAASYFQPSGASAPQTGSLYQYWAGPLSDGVVIGLVASNGAATLSANFADVPNLGAGTYSWKECYSGKTGSGTSVSATLGSHDMAIFHVHKSGGGSTTSTAVGGGTTTTAPPVSTTSAVSDGGTLSKYSQCGGTGWAGSGTCKIL